LEQKWATLHFGEVKIGTENQQRVFEVEVHLNDLDPKHVRVELYADGINGGGPERQEMRPVSPAVDAASGCVYRGSVSAARPATDYTARVIPRNDDVSVPLEVANILWQR